MTTLAAVLAAGAGTRFHGTAHKLLAGFRGRPLLHWAVAHALAAGLDETVVVGGAVDLTSVTDALDVSVLLNPAWDAGLASSLQIAVDHARRVGHEAVVVGLGDQPLVPTSAWRAVAAAPDDPPVAVATFGGRRRPPVRLARAVWSMLPEGGDEGARALWSGRPELVREVPCDGEPVDIDTLEDLAAMELTNNFRVGVPVDEAWAVLTDVERIAPCMPGAELQEIEADEYRGIVKVKVGPITAQYKGVARFVELDSSAHKAVLRAEGRDTRGQGNAAATITASLTPDGGGTAVSVTTDLTVTGRVAQFGRGVLADVSAKLLDQFVSCLETNVLGDAAATVELPADGAEATDAVPAAPAPEAAERTADVAPTGPGATSPLRRIDSPAAEPVDLLGAAGAPVAKRVGPVLAGLAVLWLIRVFLRRRRK